VQLLILRCDFHNILPFYQLVETYTSLTRTKSHEPAVRFADNDRFTNAFYNSHTFTLLNDSLRNSAAPTSPITTGKSSTFEFIPEQPPPPPPRPVAQASVGGMHITFARLFISRMSSQLFCRSPCFALCAVRLTVKRPNSAVNEFEFRNALVQRMMVETGQEQSVCHFFLESTEWNFETAIDMFSRMSGT
jgi:hypothetical protein